MHEELTRYYLERGLDRPQFWHGPEHPALEQVALRLLDARASRRVLEVGYQAGGFAAPIVASLHRAPGFHYTGLDSLAYPNAVSSDLLAGFFRRQGVPVDRFRLLTVDAWDFLMECPETFDLVLIDHVKSLYPRELETLLARRLLAGDGVVLLHDVLEKAAEAWMRCVGVCASFGCRWHVEEGVPGGLAIVRPTGHALTLAAATTRIRLGLRFAARRLDRALRSA